MFYMTLPSNSSLSHYPDNNAAHFYTKLPQSVDLNGDWEVGLAEINFPGTFYNVNGDTFQFKIIKIKKDNQPDVLKVGRLPEGIYATPEQLVHALNFQVTKLLAQSMVRFYFDDVTKRVYVVLFRQCRVELGSDLQKLLGFKDNTFRGPKTHFAEEMLDLYAHHHSLYVYCDIVEQRVVGDVNVPLLRTVPCTDFSKKVLYQRFDKPHYVPLCRKQFNTIEIFITSDTGEPISFQQGKSIVTLHFRPRRVEGI